MSDVELVMRHKNSNSLLYLHRLELAGLPGAPGKVLSAALSASLPSRLRPNLFGGD
jgi:hypothetical protein